MTTISEDPTLPLDPETASKIFSNSSRMGAYDSSNDGESSTFSEFEHPGTFVNLTSAGKISPHRTRTVKDQEMELGELKKENFGLKLRIYHLEEALHVRHGTKDKGWQMNIDLNVQMEATKKELAEKDKLLLQAKAAMDHMISQYENQIKKLKEELERVPRQEELQQLEEQLEELQQQLAEREKLLQDARRRADDALNRLADEEARNEQLERELEQLGDEMRRKIEDLKRELEQREIPKPAPSVKARAMQTDEDPLAGELAEAEAARDRLAQRGKELEDELSKEKKRVQELDMQVLDLMQQMTRMEGDHNQRMREKQEELDRCKRQLYDLEERMRRKQEEFEEMTRKKEAESQRVRELETQLRQLRDLLHEKDREIRDLQDRIAELERELGGDRDKDKEMQELRRKLAEAKAKRREMEAALAAKDREIKRLSDALAENEEELGVLRARVQELEEALADAEAQLHQAELDRSKHASILDRLQRELDDLRQQLKRYQDGMQIDQSGALAAKDAIIAQLHREIEDLRARLAEADRKYKLLNTTTAAEISSLRATIEDLSRKIEQLERALKAREDELDKVLGDKVGLERDLERLLKENQRLREEAMTLRVEIANQAKGMERAELDIEELRRLLDRMKEQQTRASELAALREQVEMLEHALILKEAELAGLIKTLGLRDQTIADLEQELRKLRREKREAEDRAALLELEKIRLEEELALLRSKYNTHYLSVADLQDKLARACAERDDLARKLKVTEELLNMKDKAYQDMEAMYKQLNDELLRMQQQLNDLQGGSPARHVKITRETSTSGSPSKSKSTTMVFGHLSEDILLMILQRLQELYSEISAGRADASVASSSLASKLERLRQQLQDSLHDAGQEGEEMDGERSRSTPNLSASFTRDWRSSTSPEAEVRALRAQLEETVRWNKALQARLDESRRTRDVGVGMEKEGEGQGQGGGTGKDKKYAELTREVDRLLEELAVEKEKAERERRQQEAEIGKVQDTLRRTERTVLELEEQLRAAMAQRDAGTSTDHLEEVTQLEREVEEAHATVARVSGQCEGVQAKLAEVRRQLDGAHGTIAELRAQLDFELKENKRLKDELADASFSSADHSNDSLGASSMPNLLTPEGHSQKNKSDSWTTPPPQRRGRKADISALKAKNEDMTRLNAELQRKCEEKLLNASSSSGASSSRQPSERSVHVQTHIHHDQREELQKERERELVVQVRKAEKLLLEKEEEWMVKEESLKAHLEDAQRALRVARANMAEEMKEGVKVKDEQILNLSRSLSKAREKVVILEEQVSCVVKEKTEIIHSLEEELRGSKKELESALSHLSTSQKQVHQLQKELALYQRIVEELRRATSSHNAGGQRSFEELVEKLLRELDVSVRSNMALTDQLRSRLSRDNARHSSGEDMETSFHSYVITTDGEGGAEHRERSGGANAHRKSTRNASTYVCHKTVTSKPAASSSPKTSPRLGRSSSRDFKDGGSQSNLGSSSSSSSLSHSSAHEVNGASRKKNQASQHSHFASLALHGFGDFETLETRLQRALESPTLQGADRAFLEELLLYLRQQRKQLDDNRRLLEKLDQEQQQQFDLDEAELGKDIPMAPHIPAFYSESGTIPASASFVPGPHHTSTPSSTTRHTYIHSTRSGVQAGVQTSPVYTRSVRTTPTHETSGVARVGLVATNRPSSNDYGRKGATSTASQTRPNGRTKIELGPLYEQLMQSHASLMEAKTTLLKKQRSGRDSYQPH